MSARRPGGRSRRHGAALVTGAPARVDLMPAEVRARQRELRQRGIAVRVAVGAIAVVALGLGGANLALMQAQSGLDAAQRAQTDALAQQAKYGEVTRVAAQIVAADAARAKVTGTQVRWKTFLDEYRSVLPSDAVILEYAFTGHAPWEAQAQAQGPLAVDSVASANITTRTASVPSGTDWLRAVRALPGVAGASLNSITDTPDGYVVVVTVLIAQPDRTGASK